MTTQELIQQGLEASKDEGAFRGWASQWFKPITGIPVLVARGWGSTLQGEPLEVWAFRAREAGGHRWKEGVYCLFEELATGDWDRVDMWEWWGRDATSDHWVIAGCAALEMQKEAKP